MMVVVLVPWYMGHRGFVVYVLDKLDPTIYEHITSNWENNTEPLICGCSVMNYNSLPRVGLWLNELVNHNLFPFVDRSEPQIVYFRNPL